MAQPMNTTARYMLEVTFSDEEYLDRFIDREVIKDYDVEEDHNTVKIYCMRQLDLISWLSVVATYHNIVDATPHRVAYHHRHLPCGKCQERIVYWESNWWE